MGFWRERERKDEMFREIVDRRDASTIERERDDDDVSLSIFSISIFTDLYFYL